MLVNWSPARFYLFNFKKEQSQEKDNTIFRGLNIYEITLSDQIDFPGFFHLQKMTYRNLIKSGI
jgi:hypothetical protein